MGKTFAPADRPLLHDWHPTADPTPLTPEQSELVAGCFKLACKLVGLTRPRWAPHMTYDEACSFALEQMCLAARRYDPARLNPRTGRPYAFATYIGACVKLQLRSCFLRSCLLIHVPAGRPQRGASPVPVGPLTAGTYADSGEPRDLLAYAPGPAPDEEAQEAERGPLVQRLAADALKGLGRREADVLRRRFGLAPYARRQTLQEAADLLGVTKERVRQLQERAVKRLRGRPGLRAAAGEVLT